MTTAEKAARYGTSTKRERVGWYFYDWANSAFFTTVITAFGGIYLNGVAENAADANGDISLLGLTFRAGSLWAYVISASVFLQVVVMPIAGAIADRTARKKQLLGLFAYVGAAAVVGLLFVTGDNFVLGAALVFVANVSMGASVVVYNSFLPQLCSEQERDGVSSRGWAFGYLGGGLLLLLNVVAILVGGPDNEAVIARLSLVSAGLWWAGFTILPMLWLENRPPLEGEARGSVITDGFRQFGRTLKGLNAYPLTLFFLVAFLVYNDGIQTVITMAGIYGSEELGFELSSLMPVILMVQFLAFAGALLLGRLAQRFGAWKTVLGSLVGWVAIVVAAFFLPAGQLLPFIALGAAIGLVLGGSQALSRSLFSQLIPKGKEGEYFSFYEISDKGTSWLGPWVFGLTYDMTGSYRTAIISLIIFFVLGFFALLAVPIRKAITQAGNTPPRIL
jgi:MFS transporter, UMF1 family